MTGDDLELVRRSIATLAEKFQTLWMEKKALRLALIHHYNVAPEIVDNMEAAGRADATVKQEAKQEFAHMWKALDDAAFQVFINETLSHGPLSGSS